MEEPQKRLRGGPRKITVTKSVKEKLLQMDKKQRREFIRELRARRKPQFAMVQDAKHIWEKLRSRKTPQAKKTELAQKLHELVRGKATELIFAHDTSRILQCLLATGNTEIRDSLFEELTPELKRMCKSQYARFFVTKMLKNGTKQQRDTIVDALRGYFPKLLQSKVSATIVELIYNDYATAAQRFAIVREFFGNEFVIFGAGKDVHSLDQLLKQKPAKMSLILNSLEATLKVLVDKEQLKHTLTHKLLYDYITHCNGNQKAEMLTLVREQLPTICHSREGAEVSLECIWNSTAKDRKTIVKSFNGLAVKCAIDQFARRVLFGLFDSIDDTILLNKHVTKELGDYISDIVYDKYGVTVLHYIVQPRNPNVFGKTGLVDLLKRGDGNVHSKKEAAARYKEVYDCIAESIHAFLAGNMREVLTNKTSAVLVLNALEPSGPAELFERSIDAETARACFDAIAELVNDDYIPHVATAAGDEEAPPHILQGGPARFVFKKLLKADSRQPATKMSDSLAQLPAEQLQLFVAQNSGCFDLLHMATSGSDAARAAVLGAISLKTAKQKAATFEGAQLLLAELKDELRYV